MPNYPYLVSDTASDSVNPSLLKIQIQTATITPVLQNIRTNGNAIEISFNSSLSTEEVTALDAVIAAHDGSVNVISVGKYAEVETEVSTTGTSYVTRLTMTVPSDDTKDVILFWSAELGQTSNDRPARFRVLFNNVVIAEYWETMRIRSTTTEFRPVGGFKKITLSSSLTNTVLVQYCSTNDGGSAKLRNVRLFVKGME